MEPASYRNSLPPLPRQKATAEISCRLRAKVTNEPSSSGFCHRRPFAARDLSRFGEEAVFPLPLRTRIAERGLGARGRQDGGGSFRVLRTRGFAPLWRNAEARPKPNLSPRSRTTFSLQNRALRTAFRAETSRRGSQASSTSLSLGGVGSVGSREASDLLGWPHLQVSRQSQNKRGQS